MKHSGYKSRNVLFRLGFGQYIFTCDMVISFHLGIGGDPFNGTNFMDCLDIFLKDPETNGISTLRHILYLYNVVSFAANSYAELQNYPFHLVASTKPTLLCSLQCYTIPTLPLFEMAKSACSSFILYNYFLLMKFISAFYHVTYA